MLTYKNTREEIEKSGVDIVVIPVGSVEQHSTHLPVGTDCMQAEALSAAVAEQLNAYLLPVLPISTCYEHKGTGGSVWMRPTTFYIMLQDIVLSLQSQGFKKVVVILGHGGTFAAGPAVRELNALYDDLQVILVNPIMNEEIKVIMDSKKTEIHAGEVETSVMLYLHEELVDKEKMKENDFVPDCPQAFLNHTPVYKLSNAGTWGEPSLATKEKGEEIFKIQVDSTVDFIKKAFEMAPADKW